MVSSNLSKNNAQNVGKLMKWSFCCFVYDCWKHKKEIWRRMGNRKFLWYHYVILKYAAFRINAVEVQ